MLLIRKYALVSLLIVSGMLGFLAAFSMELSHQVEQFDARFSPYLTNYGYAAALGSITLGAFIGIDFQRQLDEQKRNTGFQD